MVVPEPEAGFGLWPRVKARTGWLESNEDGLALLAVDWGRVGRLFEAAGALSLDAFRQAWGDDAGALFLAQAGQTLINAAEAGASMRGIARKVVGFSDVVAGVKNGVRETITVNDPVYGLLGLLPAPIAGPVQAAFANKVAANLTTAINAAAVQVAGQGATTAGQVPRPLPAGPASGGTDPYENARWWAGLTAGDKRRFIHERPALMAGLDGVPAEARDDANRILLDRAIADLQNADRPLGYDPYGRVGDLIDERLNALTDLRAALGPSTGYDPNAPAPRNDQHYYLLGFDNERDGRAIVASGNPDTAANVATFVPGILNDITTVAAPGDAPQEQNLLERIDVLRRAADEAGSPSTSVIGWLDYDSPGPIGTFDAGPAEAARDDLRTFQQGLRASHVGGPSHNTLIGHSYGALVAGLAARDGDLILNDFVSVAGLGTGTEHAVELRAPNVWATELEDDRRAELGQPIVHGTDPTDIRFGARVFESDPRPGVTLPQGAHSGYFDEVDGNAGLENIGKIIATRNGLTYPETLDRRPVVTEDFRGESDVNYDPP